MPVRMRFVEQVLEELRRDDPDTPITLNYLRSLAASGKIPVVMVGRRRLINYDALVEYLRNPPKETLARGSIRRVAER